MVLRLLELCKDERFVERFSEQGHQKKANLDRDC